MLSIGGFITLIRCCCFCFASHNTTWLRGWLYSIPLFAHLGIAIWGCVVYGSQQFKDAVNEDVERFDDISTMFICMLWSVLVGWTLIASGLLLIGVIIIVLVMIHGPGIFQGHWRGNRQTRLLMVRETINRLSRD